MSWHRVWIDAHTARRATTSIPKPLAACFSALLRAMAVASGSGAIVGTGVGAANARNAAGYL
jgi:hypothetical protein